MTSIFYWTLLVPTCAPKLKDPSLLSSACHPKFRDPSDPRTCEFPFLYPSKQPLRFPALPA